MRAPQFSTGSTWDEDEEAYLSAGPSSHANHDTREPDLHDTREHDLHDTGEHDLRRQLRSNPPSGSRERMYDYPYVTSGPTNSGSGARNTDQIVHPLLNPNLNLRDSQVFRPRIVEVLGDNSRDNSTSISQRSWNTPPTSNQWKEADKNKLLHLLQALKQRQT